MAGSAVNEAGAAVRCMRLPVAGGALLVPSAAVAEVVVVPGVEALASAPWLAGFIDWRGLRIGLLDLAVAPGEVTPSGAEAAHSDAVPGERAAGARRVAVLHALGLNSGLPPGLSPGFNYYGIAIAQLPTVVLVDEDSARVGLSGPWPSWVAAELGVADGTALLPAFEVLERMLDEALCALG